MSDEEFDRAVIQTEGLDATHNEDIRELVEWWRGRADRSPPNARIAFEDCADELEELIDGK